MASKPGVLTEWPWKPLGSLKYIILAPWAIHGLQSFFAEEEETDLYTVLGILMVLWRMVHSQIWITISRQRTLQQKHRIVDKGLEFEQVDRERNWDDQILFSGILYYVGKWIILGDVKPPLWRADGVVITALVHMGPVEFLYYWFHRALHHHYLYSRYHSHHHSSIVTEPITAVTHPFAEHIAYYALFFLPILATAFTHTISAVSLVGYITYVDFMNYMGHTNFEFVPKWLFSVFPLLKYLMYTPAFHSLHHTQFRTNYSLFMPFYDYIYGTVDQSSDSLYEASLQRQEKTVDAVHLTHLITPQSIYQSRLGFPFLAAEPLSSRWYLCAMWPVTLCCTVYMWFCGRTFIQERIVLGNLEAQSWVIPRFFNQYGFQRERVVISELIEEAILQAKDKGVKVMSLGLQNQSEELNKDEVYLERHPKLKVKIVDGCSLIVGIVLNCIPKETTQVLLIGKLSKVAYSLASQLCQKGIQVATLKKDVHEKLRTVMNSKYIDNLILTTNCNQKVWLVGEELTEKKQDSASKGTIFIPFSEFPPKKLVRKDCLYLTTPAMVAPKMLKNLHSCENWLPRRAMSASRVAGIVHALEGWDVHECGDTVFDIDKIWQASLHHGFRPLPTAAALLKP